MIVNTPDKVEIDIEHIGKRKYGIWMPIYLEILRWMKQQGCDLFFLLDAEEYNCEVSGCKGFKMIQLTNLINARDALTKLKTTDVSNEDKEMINKRLKGSISVMNQVIDYCQTNELNEIEFNFYIKKKEKIFSGCGICNIREDCHVIKELRETTAKYANRGIIISYNIYKCEIR